METPAGWYDDGSGRQRWWDGQQWTEQYSDTAPAAPAADTTNTYGAPATTATYSAPATTHAYGVPATTVAPRATKPSIIGLIALGAAVLGTILACIPATIIIGWVLLPIAFILSIIAFFIKGKKWAPIAAVSVSVVGTIIAIIVAIILAGVALAAYTEEISSSTSSVAPEDDSAATEDDTDLDGEDISEDGAFRPTGDEVGAGLGEVLTSTGVEAIYTEEQLSCIGDVLVASDMSDDSLQTLATGNYPTTNANDMTIFSEALTEDALVCLAQ